MAQDGADFQLPDEILSVIPADPYDQLDVARKITSMAIASRVSRLEGETGRLRQRVAKKDRVVAELQGRLGQLEGRCQEADARLRASLEENIKLAEERDALVQTTKKLSRELAKLETFKRHLMQSLNEDNSSHVETLGMGTFDQSTSKSSYWKGRTPRVDGKEFFRQARNCLSYEQFGAFLANIKEFNARRQSREETLTKAEEIFGTDNKDLSLSFQGLLYRNLS